MANFFIRRPIVAIVIAILTVIVGAIIDRNPACSPVSEDRPARDQVASHLCGCGRADSGASGCHAHRAAS